MNLLVALRDVAGKQTYPRDAEQIDQLKLPTSDDVPSTRVDELPYKRNGMSVRGIVDLLDLGKTRDTAVDQGFIFRLVTNTLV